MGRTSRMGRLGPTGFALLLAAASIVSACGDEPIEHRSVVSTPLPSTLVVTPNLEGAEITAAFDNDEIAIDELIVNVTEVRLISADPRIPAAGLTLINGARLVSSRDGQQPRLELNIPEPFRSDPDLAIYIRLGPSESLGGAAVVVRGRYGLSFNSEDDPYALPNATDPDVDPMGRIIIPGGECGHANGNPLLCSDSGIGRPIDPIPDSDPTFELRDDQIVDLVTPLGTDANSTLIIGVPASLWVSPLLFEAFDDAERGREPLVFDAQNDGLPAKGVLGFGSSGYVLRRGSTAQAPR